MILGTPQIDSVLPTVSRLEPCDFMGMEFEKLLPLAHFDVNNESYVFHERSVSLSAIFASLHFSNFE